MNVRVDLSTPIYDDEITDAEYAEILKEQEESV